MSSRSARLSLFFSCLGHGYMHVFTAIYFVIVLAVEKDWGLPYADALKLWFAGSLMVGLAALPAGWLADRWSAAGMMVVFFIGLGAAGIACAFADGPTALWLGLAAVGLFAAIYHPVGITWLVNNAASRGLALGINGIFGSLGIAFAALIAGGLIDLSGWRAAFLAPALVSLVTGLGLWFCLACGWIVDADRPRVAETPASRGDMLRAFLILIVTMTVMGIVFQSVQTSLPKVFDLRLRSLAGEGTLGIGMLLLIVYATGAVMQVIGGVLADRYPLKPIYVGSFVFQALAMFFIAYLGGLPLMLASLVSVLMSTAPLPAENILLARYTPERHRSLAFGVKYVLAFGTGPLTVWLVAFVQERTGEFVWLYMLLGAAALLAVAASVFLPGSWRHKSAAIPAPVAAE